MSSSRCALFLALFVAPIACTPREQAPPVQPGAADWHRPLDPRPSLEPPQAASDSPGSDGLLAVVRKPQAPTQPWRARTALALTDMQARDPVLYKRLLSLQPDRRVGTEMFFSQPELAAPHAAPVLLKRLLNGDEPVAVRLAVVDALPATAGDWHEGAAALASLDASRLVRKKLVEMLRYVPPPHNIEGLRRAFRDEELTVRVAAARTTGFTRNGIELYIELMSATFDEDWDLRAAAVQGLGQLRVRAAWDRLVGILADDHPQVRQQALISLERIDPAAARQLAELPALAKQSKLDVAVTARRLLKERAADESPAGASVPGGAGGKSGGPPGVTTQPAQPRSLSAPGTAAR